MAASSMCLQQVSQSCTALKPIWDQHGRLLSVSTAAGGGVMSATPSGRVTPPAVPQVGSACPVGCLCVELGSALAERSDMLEEAWLLGNRPHPGNMCVGSMCNKRLPNI
ncbi:unnamed protein product [Boreogadus saida]